MRKLVAALFFISIHVFAGAYTLQWDAEARARFAIILNRDMDFSANRDAWLSDARIRIGLSFEDDKSPLSCYYQLEVGNMPWGDLLKGGALGSPAPNVTTRRLSVDWKDEGFHFRAGLLGLSTPIGVDLDTDGPAVMLSYKDEEIKAEAFFSRPFAGPGTNSAVDIGNLLNKLTNDTLLCGLSGSGKFLDFWKASGWYMFLADQRYSNRTFLHFGGMRHEYALDDYLPKGFGLGMDTALAVNGGETVVSTNSPIPVLGYYAMAALKAKTPWVDVYGSFITTSGNAEGANDGTLRQFQTIGNDGNLDTGMGLLFGGSSFNQQSYWSDDRASFSRKNLSTGDINFNDRGLTIVEAGLSKKLSFKGFKWTPKLSGGIGFTTESVSNRNVLGIELDFHNRFELSASSAIRLSAAFLLPGNTMRFAYQMEHNNYLLGSDPAFKIDGMVEVKLN